MIASRSFIGSTALACAALVAVTAPSFFTPALLAQQTAAFPFEDSPVLNAQVILKPEFYQGPYHKVRDAVPTYSGANQYKIDSEFGYFEANGNDLLVQRVAEIYAIAQLREISKTEEYKNAFLAAAKSPLVLAKDLSKDPVGTVSAVPKGIWKFMNRAGQGIKEAASGGSKSEYEDNVGKNILGVSKAKRELAAALGVSPYSSNEVLQKELNAVAWTCAAGNLTISALAMGLTGGASIAATTVSVATSTTDALRDSTPTDLRLMNLKKLLAMGIPRKQADAFLANPAFSPWHQTLLVASLQQLEGVKGRAAFIRAATIGVEDEHDALFFSRTAYLMLRVYKGPIGISSITVLNGLPVCVAKDGRVVVALEWDYAAWTPMTDQFMAKVKEFSQKQSNGKKPASSKSGYFVAISGQISPLLQEVLTSRNVDAQGMLDPGPLKTN